MNTLTATNDTATRAPGAPLVIRGTAGHDTIQGSASGDIIDAGDGDDYLFDDQGANQLLGGDGHDTIIGCGVINGGPGDDLIVAAGDASGNIYQYAPGDGDDIISAKSDQNESVAQGILQFGQGVTPSQVRPMREGPHLILQLGGSDRVSLPNWFAGPQFQLEQISFADGTIWRPTDITAKDIVVFGTDEDDVMHGYGGNNLIHGGAGDDYIVDGEGDNIIHGGQGNDSLMGRGVLDGGPGDDTLLAAGDAQYNVYFFDAGDGRDTLHAHGDDNPGHPQGTLAFGAELDTKRLWFRRQDDDLAVTVVGSHAGITIKDWYRDATNQVARFMSGDDKILNHDKVDTLVQAMAHFAPPMSGSDRLDPSVSLALAPVLAASWA